MEAISYDKLVELFELMQWMTTNLIYLRIGHTSFKFVGEELGFRSTHAEKQVQKWLNDIENKKIDVQKIKYIGVVNVNAAELNQLLFFMKTFELSVLCLLGLFLLNPLLGAMGRAILHGIVLYVTEIFHAFAYFSNKQLAHARTVLLDQAVSTCNFPDNSKQHIEAALETVKSELNSDTVGLFNNEQNVRVFAVEQGIYAISRVMGVVQVTETAPQQLLQNGTG